MTTLNAEALAIKIVTKSSAVAERPARRFVSLEISQLSYGKNASIVKEFVLNVLLFGIAKIWMKNCNTSCHN